MSNRDVLIVIAQEYEFQVLFCSDYDLFKAAFKTVSKISFGVAFFLTLNVIIMLMDEYREFICTSIGIGPK